MLRTVRFFVANVIMLKGLSDAECAAQPLAGHLFAFDLEVPGPQGHRAGTMLPERHCA
jgi:hypothetical protein